MNNFGSHIQHSPGSSQHSSVIGNAFGASRGSAGNMRMAMPQTKLPFGTNSSQQ